LRAAAVSRWRALADVEGAIVVAAHQVRRADVQEAEAVVLGIAAVAAVVHRPEGDREWTREEVAAVVRERAREVQRSERGRTFDPEPLSRDRPGEPEVGVVAHIRSVVHPEVDGRWCVTVEALLVHHGVADDYQALHLDVVADALEPAAELHAPGGRE